VECAEYVAGHVLGCVDVLVMSVLLSFSQAQYSHDLAVKNIKYFEVLTFVIVFWDVTHYNVKDH
jgi:hypothetical protein